MPRDHGKGSVTTFWFCENSWNPFLILLTLSLLLANGPQPPTFLNNYQGSKMAVILNQNMHAQ